MLLRYLEPGHRWIHSGPEGMDERGNIFFNGDQYWIKSPPDLGNSIDETSAYVNLSSDEDLSDYLQVDLAYLLENFKPDLDGVGAIEQEWQRQINQLGYDAVHDAQHSPDQLLDAALWYLLGTDAWVIRSGWPFPGDEPGRDDNLQCLIRAGALIAATINRFRCNTNN